MSPKEFGKRIGKTVKTLQRWDNAGKLIAHRTPTNRRFYTEDQYNQIMGINSNNNKISVIYARVSTANQKDDLENQVDFLQTYCNARGVIISQVITDIGSGLNYNRKKWNKLLDDVISGNIENIYIAYPDRFIRFGFDWFECFCNKFGTKIVVVNNKKLSPEQELTEDLINIIHVFSCRSYGLRKYRKGLSNDKNSKD
ncbi:IS607 family transposase [Apilactobacillus xinyiensis]|uniref:IS607 family transposase n=1 Tax=Apilactobacillus xinyiensis TaxID=2841032 RepID=UPI001C7D18F2|nr:IS607 family transposase [Apilactobacillus xinyiensis]